MSKTTVGKANGHINPNTIKTHVMCIYRAAVHWNIFTFLWQTVVRMTLHSSLVEYGHVLGELKMYTK